MKKKYTADKTSPGTMRTGLDIYYVVPQVMGYMMAEHKVTPSD